MSAFDIVRKYLPYASEAMIVSPWITEEAVGPIQSVLKDKRTTVVSFPKGLQRDDGLGMLRSLGARVFSGPVHAKLYVLRNKNGPFLAVFGSENLTRSHNEELVLTSTNTALNTRLVGAFSRFLSRCSRQ